MRRSPWWLFLLGLALVALFINNGLWQLRRQHEKQARQAVYDVAANVVPVRRWDQLAASGRVVLRGEWVPAATVFLDNKSYRGQPGFHVLTPLRLPDAGGVVVVNRGWVAAGRDRRHLPVIATPAGPVELTGRVLEPVRDGFSLGESTAEPGIWQRLDPQRFKPRVEGPLAERYVQQESAAQDGLVRDWPRPDFGAEKHLSYAWQWFAFAIMTIGWMLWFGWQKFTKVRART